MTDHKITSKWITSDEAARRLNATPLNVLMHIKRGLLVGVELEGGWLVDPDSLALLLERRRAEGVPAVCRSTCGTAHGCKSCG